MVDMLYLNRPTMDLNIHYNRLPNQMKAEGMSSASAFGVQDICSATSRPINLIKDIFLAPSAAAELKKDDNHLDTALVVVSNVGGASIVGAFEPDPIAMPARLHLGDISSDGYTDLIATLLYIDGTS